MKFLKVVAMMLLVLVVQTLNNEAVNAQSNTFGPGYVKTGIPGTWVDLRGYSSLATALAAIAAVGNPQVTLAICTEQTVAVNTTIPTNVALYITSQGGFNVTAGTLTVSSRNIFAEDRSIFRGAGTINFAVGAQLRSSWFTTIDYAIAQTSNDTVSLMITAPATFAASAAVGANVRLVFESPGNIFTVPITFTLSNIDQIVAGKFQCFGGAGDFSFVNGPELRASWFDHLRSAIIYIGTDVVTLVNDVPETLFANLVIPATTTFRVDRGAIIDLDAYTLGIGLFECGLYQAFDESGVGRATFTTAQKGSILPQWWGIDGVADDVQIQDAINSIAAIGGTVFIPNGTYVILTMITQSADNTAVVFDTGAVLTTISDITVYQLGDLGTADCERSKLLGFSATKTGASTLPGLVVRYAKNCEVSTVRISGFHTGMKLTGEVSYSRFDLGHFLSNTVYDIWIHIDALQWVTECRFYDGRFASTCTYHVFIDDDGGVALNNLRFLFPCFEGTANYAVECEGWYCSFLWPRGEGTWTTDAAALHFAAGTIQNRVTSDFLGLGVTDNGTRSSIDTDYTWSKDFRALTNRTVFSLTRSGPDTTNVPAFLMSDTYAASGNNQVLDLHLNRYWQYGDYFLRGYETLSNTEKFQITGNGYYLLRESATQGGLYTAVFHASVNIAAAATAVIDLNVPVGTKLVGCQIRVDAALAGGDLWDAAYSGGSVQVIATAQAVAQNTKVNKFYDENAATAITAAVATDITLTKNGGGNFTAQGTVEAIVYTETLYPMDNY